MSTMKVFGSDVPTWVVGVTAAVIVSGIVVGVYFASRPDWTAEHVTTLQQDLQNTAIDGHKLTMKQSVAATEEIKKAFTYKELTKVITAVKTAKDNNKDLKDLPKDILDLLQKLADIIAKYIVKPDGPNKPVADCTTCFGGADCASEDASTNVRCAKVRLNDPNPGVREEICAMLAQPFDEDSSCGHCYRELHDQSGCSDGIRHKKDDQGTCASLRTGDCLNMEAKSGDDKKFIDDCYVNAARAKNSGNYYLKNKNVVDGINDCIRECQEGNFDLPGCKDLCSSACHNLANQGPVENK